MDDAGSTAQMVLRELQERAKELNCLYEVEEVLGRAGVTPAEAFLGVVKALPPGWQYPDVCSAEIVYGEEVYRTAESEPTPWVLRGDILLQQRNVGSVRVYYTREMPQADVGPFLKEEERLIHTVADRLSHFLQHQELRRSLEEFRLAEERLEDEGPDEWRGAVHLLRATDLDLYLRIARRVVNFLRWNGGDEVQSVLRQAHLSRADETRPPDSANYPGRRKEMDNSFYLSDTPFELADTVLGGDQVLSRLQQWMLDDKAGFLVHVLAKPDASLGDIANALRRFQRLVPREEDLPLSTAAGLKVSLIRRFLTDELEFIGVAKKNVEIADFREVADRLVLPARAHGRLGGKSAGLFLARQVLKRGLPEVADGLPLAYPKSWYVVSDGLSDFVDFNGLEEWVVEQKYKDAGTLRQEYAHLVHLFKNASFSPEVVKGLSMALDDFGASPLVARSSSLAEDRLGTAFSGKYKSLFLANQGTKKQRLEALLDAIAEIYASTFGPDAIEYRRERGLLDYDEDMGILLQEVVGARAGRYFLPSFAGVALSTNEFRWSPSIARDDGLLRMVPGLGTRAVDRLTDDYPVLLAPGRPGLRANATTEEVVRYAPRRIDVIDLETNAFESRGLANLVREVGSSYPGFSQVFSLLEGGRLRRPSALLFEPGRDEVVATFEGLVSDTPFVEQMRGILSLLRERLGLPVEIEFASDGEQLYLLQCRPQSYAADAVPVPIPKDVPESDVLFRSRRHISNGVVPDLTHVVYVDPAAYERLDSLLQLQAVGRAVGLLNHVLPRRRFMLLGPGRWGSRGDIRLGVNVSYADISNTAVLAEMAHSRGDYLPELSFGTHFFQDLVESSIRYVPIYLDDPSTVFRPCLLLEAPNLLAALVPEHAALAGVIHVVDVPAATGGKVLRVFLNADADDALGMLVTPV